MTQPLRKLPRLLLIIFLNVAVLLVLLEIGAYAVHGILLGGRLDKNRVRAELFVQDTQTDVEDTTANRAPGPDWLQRRILHPYIGFVEDPRNRRVSKYGFPTEPMSPNQSEDTYVIAITGGSVAMNFYRMGRETLEAELRRSSYFQERAIEIQSFAMSGFKQPQQLASLTYLLLSGEKIELCINLDGFNEIALPIKDNLDAGVSLLFPRSWNLFARKAIDVEAAKALGAILLASERRHKTREFFRKPVLSHSAVWLSVWEWVDQRQAAAQFEMNERLTQLLGGQDTTPQITGPPESFEKRSDVYEESARIWMESSLMMAAVCESRDIAYYHFLQPNQYVEGSKPLTDEEKRSAIYEGPYVYKEAVREGYPLLTRQAGELEQRGILFKDLTQIYSEEQRSIYIDTCCHVNELGNETMAKEIADFIIANLPDKR